MFKALTDRTVKAITLMGTFSAYFNYVSSTMCHIPQFTLEGTVDDWAKVKSIPEKIISLFNLKPAAKDNGLSLLQRWLDRLQPILHEMYLARTGVANSEFWQSFYKYKSHSGGNCVSGNIIYFYPFLKRPEFRADLEDIRLNEWIMERQVRLGKMEEYGSDGPRTDELTTNIVEVDFKLEHRVNGQAETFDMGMKAGIVAYKENSDNKLQTHVDYSIFFKKKKPDDFRLKSKGAASAEQAVGSQSTIQAAPASAAPAQVASSSSLFAAKPKKKIQFELVLEEDNAPTPALK